MATVAAGVLVGLAIYFQWGTPAICSLAAVSGLSFVAALAISLCKLRPRHRTIEERFPIPSESMPNAFQNVDNPRASAENTDRSAVCSEQLHELVKGDNINLNFGFICLRIREDFSEILGIFNEENGLRPFSR